MEHASDSISHNKQQATGLGFSVRLVRILEPVGRPLSRWLLSPARKFSVHQYETITVGLLLMIMATVTSPHISIPNSDPGIWKTFLVNWLSAIAVFGSFLYANTSHRMTELAKTTNASVTATAQWSERYWIGKEIIWIAVFFMNGIYPAILSSLIFICYPIWRRIYLEEQSAYTDEMSQNIQTRL